MRRLISYNVLTEAVYNAISGSKPQRKRGKYYGDKTQHVFATINCHQSQRVVMQESTYYELEYDCHGRHDRCFGRSAYLDWVEGEPTGCTIKYTRCLYVGTAMVMGHRKSRPGMQHTKYPRCCKDFLALDLRDRDLRGAYRWRASTFFLYSFFKNLFQSSIWVFSGWLRRISYLRHLPKYVPAQVR